MPAWCLENSTVRAHERAPVQRDVEILGVRMHGPAREASLLRAEFLHDGHRAPLVAQPRFRRDADAAGLQRAGPACAAAHVQQAAAFRHQAHHGAELLALGRHVQS